MDREINVKTLPVISYVIFCLLLISSIQNVSAGEMNLYLSPTEGGKLKPTNQTALVNYLSENECKISFTNSKANAHLLLSLQSTIPGNYHPYLKIKTHANLPLNLSILVKSSRSVDHLDQLKGEPLAIIHPYSEIGFLSQYVELAAKGLSLEESPIFESGRYDGALALLLHGDVFAAAIPYPLAKKWKVKNKLNIIATSSSNEFPYLWIRSDIKELKQSTIKACSLAFVKMGTRNRRDKRFSVFPLWLEGFSAL